MANTPILNKASSTQLESQPSIRASRETTILKCCFGKTRSRLTGAFMRLHMPFRQYLFRSLLSQWEQSESDLDSGIESFKSLSEFFSRRLKAEARPIASFEADDLISPCDGKVVHYEQIDNPDEIEWLTQLKGAKYRVSSFLGRDLTSLDSIDVNDSTLVVDPSLEVVKFKAMNVPCPQCGFPQVLQDADSVPIVINAEEVSNVEKEEYIMSTPKRNESDENLKKYLEQQSTLAPSTRDLRSTSSSFTPSLASNSASTLASNHRKGPSLVWHYFVIYLAPSDYHHFHAPCELTVHRRRHFAGEVMPVCKYVASRLNNLFAVNERVVLEGSWRHGKFYYVPISAYNVADIRLTFEPGFGTNLPKKAKGPGRGRCHILDYLPASARRIDYNKAAAAACEHAQHHMRHPQSSSSEPNGQGDGDPGGIQLYRGDEIGEFKLGSTIVLLFQGPPKPKHLPTMGSHLKMGQLLASFH